MSEQNADKKLLNAVEGDSRDSPDNVSKPPSFESSLWLSYSDQRFVLIVLSVALVGLGACWIKMTAVGYDRIDEQSEEIRSHQYRININTASWYEFALLEGIGPSYSKRIIEYRQTHGPFKSIDDLKRVKGIGDQRLEKMRPWLTLGNEDSDQKE